MATTLTQGRKYSDADLDFAGWNASDCEGLHYLDFFDDGEYLGPDADGVEPLFEADQPLPVAESDARSRLGEWVRCYENDEWNGELSPDLFAMECFNATDAVCNRDGTLHLAHCGHSHWADDDEVVRFIEWLETVDAI